MKSVTLSFTCPHCQTETLFDVAPKPDPKAQLQEEIRIKEAELQRLREALNPTSPTPGTLVSVNPALQHRKAVTMTTPLDRELEERSNPKGPK
jgi:uncharacterized Zn finger protein (UPF0148 family)